MPFSPHPDVSRAILRRLAMEESGPMNHEGCGVVVGPVEQLRDKVAALTVRVEALERRLDAASRSVGSELLDSLASTPEAIKIREGIALNRKA